MSTHKICFCEKNKKNMNTIWMKNVTDLQLCVLSLLSLITDNPLGN